MAYSIPANNTTQARSWATLNQDLNKAKDLIREIRESGYCDYLGSNCGMVLNYVLRVMLSSKDATFYASRDRVSKDIGIPEKTVEYNIKKLIKLGIFETQKFVCYRNKKNFRNCLTINMNFRRKFKKYLSEAQELESTKNLKENGLPSICEAVQKQDYATLCAGVVPRPASELSCFERAVSLLCGLHGVRVSVRPVLGKRDVKCFDGRLYSRLSRNEKISALREIIENQGGGFSITVPEGYVMVDCDTKPSFELGLMENYLGGFIVESPRGGKFLLKLRNNPLPKSTSDVEFHGAGRRAVCGGTGYKFLAMSEPALFKKETNLTKTGKIRKVFDSSQLANISAKEVESGSRNEYLFRLGRSLKNSGFSYEYILEVLVAKNSEFAVGLPATEVSYLAKHCVRYRNRYDWKVLPQSR